MNTFLFLKSAFDNCLKIIIQVDFGIVYVLRLMLAYEKHLNHWLKCWHQTHLIMNYSAHSLYLKKGRKAKRREVEESAGLKFSDILCCHKCFPAHGHATKWLSLALSQAKAAGGPWLMLGHQHHRCGQILIIPQTDHGTNFYLSPCHKIWQLSWLH